jgi:hypothetical protein
MAGGGGRANKLDLMMTEECASGFLFNSDMSGGAVSQCGDRVRFSDEDSVDVTLDHGRADGEKAVVRGKQAAAGVDGGKGKEGACNGTREVRCGQYGVTWARGAGLCAW